MSYKFFIFIIILVGLFAFQAKIIMPFAEDIAASDLFLFDSGDDASRYSTETSMTNVAFDQCNMYIATELLPEKQLTFAEKPISSFKLGNYQYLINSEIEALPSTDDTGFIKKYSCQIRYTEEDDATDLNNPENWSVSGISGLDGL